MTHQNNDSSMRCKGLACFLLYIDREIVSFDIPFLGCQMALPKPKRFHFRQFCGKITSDGRFIDLCEACF